MRTSRFMLFPLVALWISGCDEHTPTEPDAMTTPGFAFQGTRTSLSSTFDMDTDGWTLVGDAENVHGWGGNYWLQPRHIATGGNPDGAVYAIDEGRGMPWFWHVAPKFLGNRSGAYGGSLEYDLKVSPDPGAQGCDIFYTADVILAGGGKTLVVEVIRTNLPGTAWRHYSVDLSEDAGWRVQNMWSGAFATADDMKSVLKDLQVLRIRGEYLDCGGDEGYLDNVRVIPKGHAK